MIKNTTHSSIGCNGMANNDDYHGLEMYKDHGKDSTTEGYMQPDPTTMESPTKVNNSINNSILPHLKFLFVCFCFLNASQHVNSHMNPDHVHKAPGPNIEATQRMVDKFPTHKAKARSFRPSSPLRLPHLQCLSLVCSHTQS